MTGELYGILTVSLHISTLLKDAWTHRHRSPLVSNGTYHMATLEPPLQGPNMAPHFQVAIPGTCYQSATYRSQHAVQHEQYPSTRRRGAPSESCLRAQNILMTQESGLPCKLNTGHRDTY